MLSTTNTQHLYRTTENAASTSAFPTTLRHGQVGSRIGLRTQPDNLAGNLAKIQRGEREHVFVAHGFRIIATQKWRFLSLTAGDPLKWCTWCNEGVWEDISHCQWSCPMSLSSVLATGRVLEIISWYPIL